MHFKFDGNTYRIAFHHAVSTAWIHHTGHQVNLVQRKSEDGRPTGPAMLVCVTCTARDLGEWLETEGAHKDVVISPSGSPRHTSCQILIAETSEDWQVVGTGEAVPNLDAGDHFNREKGRLLSLKRAIHCVTNARRIPGVQAKSFHIAALTAYHTRPRKERAGAGGAI